ncbi:ABC transporter substrate-binding protein [Sphingosinicellaceae bacterium]|nr:ABC transporter substrate-binding protein [Sphingosinicellaceae bacterium]
MRVLTRISVSLLALSMAPFAVSAPAMAQAASPADSQAASKFVDDLSVRVFTLLKDKSLSKSQIRAKFRVMLRDAFALDDIGNRLIRRYRNQITPAQYAAYQAALPEFAINAYGDRLMNYANATVTPVRTVPRGARGDVDVYSRVTVPNRDPFDAIWTVRKDGSGFRIINLTISGINLSLTQEADFSSYIAKNGFDALVSFMKSSNAKAAT